MSSTKNDPKAETADDLDDLDDILDEFNEPAKVAPTTKTEKPSSEPVASTSNTQSTKAATATEDGEEETEDQLNERFARELAEGMEALMKGVTPDGLPAHGLNPAAGQGEGEVEGLPNEEEMMRQFEQMMADMGFGGGGAPGAASGPGASGSGPTASGSKQAPAAPPANFQDAIKSTMSRLRESDQTATSNASQANEMDFEKLMEALGNVSGAEGEEGVAAMLENMMSELMGKEVLYEPLKELRDKYPAYLANPPAQLSAEDRTRYEEQQKIVNAVVATFDDPKFDNGTEAEKAALKSKVQGLMNDMQDQGAPPQEIIGDLPPELGNMPGMGGDENCCVM
ncbi:Pex19-domain-containing protein [Meira miltonrushii]|uniref:Pex19-domain-containing protein n=1 Tax=Meira miltonrushii TaxID=1280837 RepID=A0A316VNQ9_9BASI|nr:Pex19-domain-containing protein [Meira miltonrushii]PWN38053.1 Pex19-domain-containing protein [Meira miltonrushii]